MAKETRTISKKIQKEIRKMNEVEKLKSKLKMMEISFELINKSRNDLIKQLADQEIINEKLLKELKRQSY